MLIYCIFEGFEGVDFLKPSKAFKAVDADLLHF
jgi:hypothetical protein